jgi:hypothetical protein
VASHCLGTFLIDHQGRKEEVVLYMGGTGYASFDNVYDYPGFSLRDAIAQSTLSLQWESLHHFGANRADLGLVSCKTLVRGKSNTRSGIVLISDNPRSIFPATMVNTLFCEMHFQNLGLTLFNKDPIVLRGRVENMTPAMLQNDPRVRSDSRGITTELVRLLDPNSLESFNPVGTHTLQSKNVEFYDKNDPDKRVAINTDATVQTFPHYGIDIRVAALSMQDRVVNLTWSVRNLLWDPARPQTKDIVWVVDDSHDLNVISERQGNGRLGADPLLITVQAINTSKTKPLVPSRGMPDEQALQEACLFCHAISTPNTLDVRDLVSGFAYIDVAMMRRALREGLR